MKKRTRIEKTYLIITNNSQEYIEKDLDKVIPLKKNERVVIFDNKSTDNTIGIIVNKVGVLWIYEEQYNLFINYKDEMTKDEIIKRVKNKFKIDTLFLIYKGVEEQC